ncbi:MAG TPA: protein kinase, partial [Lacipirellulaceae bacterium]|nr:protein kinase [Lacipirellulaceae bacterium]
MSNTLHDLQSQVADAAVAEFLEAVERGAPPDINEFLARHPDVSNELREFLHDYQAFEQISPRAAATAASAHTTGRTPPVVYPRLTLPHTFGGFELLEEVARGGMGIVYKARQATPRRIVALKMILAGQFASETDVQRFYAEAQAVAALDHSNIVPVFEVGNCDGQHYFTMGFVEGKSLSDRLVDGPIAASEAAAIVRDVAIAVHYAHQRGIVHRDLKPSNILVDKTDRVRVTDFGLASRPTDGTRLTCTGQLLGTPNFMPPEQLSGKPDQIGPTSDVYALGATLYALLTGRPPFQTASMADTLRQVAEREPLPPRQLDAAIPRDLETIVLKCLQKTSTRRYATAQDFADDLQRFLTDRPILARPATRVERVFRWCRRNPLAAGLSIAVVVLVVAAMSVLLVSNAQIRRESTDRAAALKQKSIALATAYDAIDQMLTGVANSRFNDVPKAGPLRVSLLQDALRYYESLIKYDEADAMLVPEMAKVLHSIATLQRELGQSEEAARSLRRSIDLLSSMHQNDSPDAQERIALMELDLAYIMGESTQSALSEDPTVERQYRTALAHLHELERRWPDRHYPYVIGLRHLAERAYKRGDLQEAEQLWRDAIVNGDSCLVQRPDDIDTRVSLCWAYLELFNRVLDNSPDRKTESEATLEKGLDHAQIALQKRPHSSPVRDVSASLRVGLARCYCQSGRAEDAIPLFKS